MTVAKTIHVTQGQFSVSANAGTLQPGCVYIIDRQSARLALTAHTSVGLRDEVNWADIQGKPDLDRPVHWDNIEGKPDLDQEVHWDEIQGKPDLGGPVQWGDVQGKPAFGSAAYATLTADTSDGVAGRVLRVGDHGIGDYLPHRSNLDLNNLPYKTTTFVGHNLQNSPAGTGWLVVQQWANSPTDMLQCVSYVHSVDEHIYYRRKRTGHWLPWQRLVLSNTPQELRNKTLVGHRERPYRPAAGGNNTIDLDDPDKSLQYLKPTHAYMSVLFTTGHAHSHIGRTVRVWLRPEVATNVLSHPAVKWPHGLNRMSSVMTSGRDHQIEFQCVQFEGSQPIWISRFISSNWPA